MCYSFPINHWPSAAGAIGHLTHVSTRQTDHFCCSPPNFTYLPYITSPPRRTSSMALPPFVAHHCHSISPLSIAFIPLGVVWEFFVHRAIVVCFDGSGSRIPVLLHVCSALWAVASGSVGACCHITSPPQHTWSMASPRCVAHHCHSIALLSISFTQLRVVP